MKLVSYLQNGDVKLGAIVQQQLYSLQAVNEQLPNDIIGFLQLGVQVRLETEKKLLSMAATHSLPSPVIVYWRRCLVLLPVGMVMHSDNMLKRQEEIGV